MYPHLEVIDKVDKDSYLLGEDNGDSIIEDAFTKHQHVKDWVHVKGVKDGNGSYRVHGRDQ